ncbi:MAG: hypothetical protein HY363_06190 [Candidatus Aenigmarchaeota archaeon]|nr:hypothetical protein [Candidatus Aenigmarchaeota archaeon]
MIKCLAVVHQGTEDTTQKELVELGAADISVLEGAVLFSEQDLKTLCSIAYQIRSATKIIWILCSGKNILEEISKTELSIVKERTFAVESEITEVGEAEIAEQIIEKTKNKVSLTTPDVLFYAGRFSQTIFFGVDLTGIDLGKRDYRIFLGPSNIKGTLAYSLLKTSGWNETKTLLDPFCQSGTVVIEAALASLQKPTAFHQKKNLAFVKLMEENIFSAVDNKIIPEKKLLIYAFDPHFKHISATQKNAKIAEVNKCLQYSRQDIDWLDIKVEPDSIDCIVTCLPAERDLKKGDIPALFLRSKKIMKKNGTITLLAKTKQQEILDAGKDYTLKEHRTVWQGQSALSIMMFQL